MGGHMDKITVALVISDTDHWTEDERKAVPDDITPWDWVRDDLAEHLQRAAGEYFAAHPNLLDLEPSVC